MSTGSRIIESLKEAVAGDFARVTIDGQVWVRATDLRADQQEIMRINNELLALLREAMSSRAPDYADAAHPGWSDRVRATIKI
jgi:hypothetical protein